MTWFIVCILMLALTVKVAAASANYSSPSMMLLRKIQQKSNPLIRPVINHSEAVVVTVNIYLHTVIELESTSQTLVTDIWVNLDWDNQHIMWEPEDYGGIQSSHVSAFDVWVPDIIVYNAIYKSQSLDDLKKDFSLTVDFTGQMQWNYPLVVKTACSLNMTYFPLDVQDCFIEISTWTFTGLEVQVKNGSSQIALEYLTENGEFELVSSEAVPYVSYYDCCPNEPYYGIKYHIVLKRLSTFYVLNIGLPTSLMLVLAFVGIFLPAESESKLNLGVTIFLSQVVMVMVVTEYTPIQSLTTPFLTKYMLNLLVMMTFYIMVCVCVVRMRTHARASVHVPTPLRVLFLNSAMLCIFFPIKWHQHRKLVCRKATEATVKDIFDTNSLPLGVQENVQIKKMVHRNGLRNPGFESDESPITMGDASTSTKHLCQVASQTDMPRDLSFQENAVCHRENSVDLFSLSEWVLLAIICERFWNMVLSVMALLIFIWSIMIIFCSPEKQCPNTVYNPWK